MSRDVRTNPPREPFEALRDLFELERRDAVDALEPHVLLGERDLDLLAEDLRLEQVLDADPEPRGLVGVARPDPAPGRADLQLAEAALARLVDRHVPRHDQVRLAGEVHVARRDAASLELVHLGEEHLRVDDAAGTDDARLPAEDAARNLANLVRLAVDDDRVPGVRTALVAAHEVAVLGQQVDDLALALVSPLCADDDGGGHG